MKMWLAEALKQYGERLEKRGAKMSTLSQTKHHARVLTNYFGVARIVQGLTVAEIDSFVSSRLETVARPSVNGSLRVLRAALHSAGIEHVTVRLLREEKRLPEVLSEDRVIALRSRWYYESSDCGHRLYTVILCALDAGLRRGEIASLTWDNIRPEGIRLKADDTKSRAEREIPMTTTLSDAFTQLEPKHFKDNKLFDPATIETASQLMKRPLFNLRKPGLHCLRRTFATRLHSKGAPLATVQALLGHADIQTTMRYVAALPEDAKAAIEALNEKTPGHSEVVEGPIVNPWGPSRAPGDPTPV